MSAISLAEAARAAGPGAQPRRALRVLVVEDERDSLLAVLLLLKTAGHEAAGVTTVREFWGRVEGFRPDVVLLDITLPDGSGYGISQELTRDTPRGKRPVIIAVTAWAKPSDRILAQLSGFDHHLAKPYAPYTLLDLLDRVAAGRASGFQDATFPG